MTDGLVEGYFTYRVATDKEKTVDIKALEKGKQLIEAKRIKACSVLISVDNIYLTGLVGAAMKRNVCTSIYLFIMLTSDNEIHVVIPCVIGIIS